MTEKHKDIELEVFGARVRIQEGGKPYTKADGGAGVTRKGINISVGNGWITPTALQLAGILSAFAKGTDAYKELALLVSEEKQQMNGISI